MIVYIVLIGGILFTGAYLFTRWSHQVGPERTREVLKKSALFALVIGSVVLLVRGGAALLALLPLLLPFLNRLLPLLYTVARLFNLRRPTGPAHQRPDGTAQRSRVSTAFLDMELDHASGELDGVITAGRFKQRRLSQLDLDQLARLYGECRSDPQSIAVLESYLDRVYPDWRTQKAGTDSGNGAADSGEGMSRADALKILGLVPGASREQIIAAHRRLMQKLHPDHGGSDYLAARVNLAKKVLLDD